MTTTAERLAFYLEAERKVLLGQSVSDGEHELQRANLADIRDTIRQLQVQLAMEQAGRHGSLRARTVVFS